MCSHVYCLSPPILLTNHCFSASTCVSIVSLSIYPPGVCSPVLICCLSSCVYVECTQLSACLFFPFGVFFVLCFISLLKKTLFLNLSPRLYLSSRFLTIVHPKLQILTLITPSHVIPRRSFIFGTQIKIFLMKSESFLTLHRQQKNYYNQGPEREKAQ